ncbi:MAG: hypothetical protein LW645_08560 [Verrucomicrobiaceae bacterium]|nr:hypothetical protein [Verrucomicrobiaceae bacterium]
MLCSDLPQHLGFVLIFGFQPPQGLLPLLMGCLGILHRCRHLGQTPERHVSSQRNDHLAPTIENKCQSGH